MLLSADTDLWFLQIYFWFKVIKGGELAYVFVKGDVKVNAPITVDDSIKNVLWWIGFTREKQRDRIYYDSIDSFSGIKMLTEKDISYLSTDFSGRTQDNGKIYFRMRRTKRMKVLLRWVQYVYRISGYPTIVDMNEVVFIEHLDITLYRAEMRKKLIDQYKTKAKEASPGPLEPENKWKDWE